MKYAQTEATAVSSEGDEAKKGQKALEKLAKNLRKHKTRFLIIIKS